MSIEKVRAYFKAQGIEGRIQEFDVSSATVELAAQAVGVEGARIAKTLSFKLEDRVLLIVCAGDAKVDNRRYKDRFGGKASMEVSTLLPPSTAVTEEPLPRWQVMIFSSAAGFPSMAAARLVTYLWEVPWNPYRRTLSFL